MSMVSEIAYVTLFQTAFGALGIVAISSMTTISVRAEKHLIKKKK